MTADARSAHPLRWAIVVMVVTFAAGVAVGVRLPPMRQAAPPGPTAIDPNMMANVLDRLELTGAQRETVDDILERRSEQTGDALRRTLSQLQVVVDSASDEIRAVLTESQRTAFDSLMTAERGRFRLRRPAPRDSAQ